MDYIHRVQRVIDKIEKYLTEEIDIDEIIADSYISKYHFYRMFSAIVGAPPMAYVRKRKLSEAAIRLLESGDRIIEIAADYGFESQEAFTRAFKSCHGFTPAKFRKERPKFEFYCKCTVEWCKIKIKNINGGIEMDIKIEEKGELKIVGLLERINMPNNTIPQLWDKFMKRMSEIKNIKGNGSYGIAENMSESSDGVSFDEIVGVEVSSFEDIPEGMVAKVIKPQKYAVFTHKGELFGADGSSKLHKSYDYVYSKLIPASGYETDCEFNFEYYDERFILGSPESEMDIYIPVK